MQLTFSKRTDVAVRACRYLHQHSGRTPGRELAVAVETSVTFLSHVLNPLVAGGWIQSRTGPAGGYQLNPISADLTLLELVQLIEGPLNSDVCVVHHKPCMSTAPCTLHTMWQQARQRVLQSLRDVRVVD